MAQIERKNYETALLAKGIPAGRIRKYGFAFCGKQVLIGKNIVKTEVIPPENLSYTVKKILKGYSFEGLY